jgi:hypothetical protein
VVVGSTDGEAGFVHIGNKGVGEESGMTDPERATIREVIASMRGRARLQIGQHEAIHRADIAKLEALVRSSESLTNDQRTKENAT